MTQALLHLEEAAGKLEEVIHGPSEVDTRVGYLRLAMGQRPNPGRFSSTRQPR